jgi:hypothetical protein
MSSWFGVRCIFEYEEHLYEERVLLVQARDLEQAIAAAEIEGDDYARDVAASRLGLVQAYEISEGIGNGSEVFSLMRESSLPPEEYLSAFFDTDMERQQVSETD